MTRNVGPHDGYTATLTTGFEYAPQLFSRYLALHKICMYVCMYVHRKSKKHLTVAHNFTKYWPIFKIISLLDSEGNP